VTVGRRSEALLIGLCVVAIANGVFLGLSLYGLLAAALNLVGAHAPDLGFALLCGAAAGIAVLARALIQEQALRKGEEGAWRFGPPAGAPTVAQLSRLVAASSLTRSPALRVLESPDPNAFTVGRSRDDATIVVTRGLLGRLDERELGAVLAHELAQIEAEDIRAVGFADAVADSIGELGRIKGRVFWGPKKIVADTLPFWLGGAALIILTPLVIGLAPESQAASLGGLVLSLGLALLLLWMLFAFGAVAFASWRGLGQLFLFATFFGPMTLIEALLAPPTAVALSRLISRTRIYEGDDRATQLVDRGALISALAKLERVEREPDRTWLGRLRFSLFVTPREQAGYRAWLEHVTSTHPTVDNRIEELQQP